MGGGQNTRKINPLFKDVKEYNKYLLSLIGIFVLLLTGIISYNYTNTSYAKWSSSIESKNTIKVYVKIPNLDESGANVPILVNGMIPVYYDSTDDVWRKADKNNSKEQYKWYDYDDKMWANSVTVTSTNREAYLKASLGTEIPMDDILTIQVWIPRYTYKVWNYNSDTVTKSNEQEIEMTFENETESTGEIVCVDNIQGSSGDGTSEICKLKETDEVCSDDLCNGKTYTHPAFTFGDQELTGFWVGKFELTGTIDAITTKPDLSSMDSKTVNMFETNIMKMNDSGNQYGFPVTVDTHMIKNIEWGAVAYLAHSKYGINKKMAINGVGNVTHVMTGCGPQSEGSTSIGSTCNRYMTVLGQSASTTGNVYGIYDMSSGSEEYVMGNMVSGDGATMLPLKSDYTISTYPENKYYDKYSYTVGYPSVAPGKLGDGSKEIVKSTAKNGSKQYRYGWFSSDYNTTYSSFSWITRGGRGSNAGIFRSTPSTGLSAGYASTRFVIAF